MDRNRDARRASVVGSNGFSRRRHRTNSLRDSPDEDGVPELQESVRLRERVKKDRDRDLRERGRERDLRERSSRSKRRRAGHGDDTSDESVNDEEEDEDDQNLAGEGGRFSSPASGSVSNHHHHGGGHGSSFSQPPQQHNSSNLQHRKTFPPSSSSSTAKVIRPPPVWKPGDETISASVPRKARSASTKRSHDWISNSNNSGNGDPNPPQPSISPAAPTSPSSSNAAVRKKLKHGPNINPGPKPKPPNASSSSAKPSSSNPEELEIEIAEVLYGLMTQSQGPPSSLDNAKPGNSLPNHYNSNNPLSAVAPKRKRPRHVPEGPARTTPLSTKPEMEMQPTELTAKSEISSPPNPAAESISHVSEVIPTATVKLDSESKDVGPSKELESSAARDQDMKSGDSPLTTIATSTPKTINSNVVCEDENRKEDKLQIDLMASPRQPRSSPEGETKIDTRGDQKPPLSTLDLDSKLPQVSVLKYNEDEKGKIASGNNIHLTNVAAAKESEPTKGSSLDFSLGLEKPERDVSSSFSPNKNKPQLPIQKNQNTLKSSKEEQPLVEKPGHLTSSLPLTMSMASWPPPVGYMTPLQGVVTPAHIQPLFSQPRPKRCATHCHIARNIHCLQQFMKSNPFWPAPGGTPATTASLFSSKPTVVGPTADLNISAKDKGSIPSNGGKEKGSQQASSSDSAQRKPQILIQQSMPSVAPTNLLGPAFIIPINQQQAAVRPASKSQSPSNTVVSTSATPSSASLPGPMSFNYPNMSPNETQYLAFLQNNAYPFTIPTVGPPLNYRGPPPPQAMPLFNGSFYPSPIMHQQLQQTSNQPSQMVQVHHNKNAGKLIQAPHNAIAGNNSSSQKQQRLQNFSSQKAQWPPHGNHYVQGGGNDDNTPSSTADNRGSRVNIYGQNFAMPIHPQSFALMTPNVLTGNQAEKKSNSQPQQGMKSGVVESLPPHSFAMSFGPGMDAQSHAMFQNCSEGARQNIQMMAAQAAQKNNFRISEESKPGNSGNHDNSFGKEDERKIFTFADTHVANNNVALARNSRPATSNGSGTMNDIQIAQAQAQQQQMMKLNHHQQQQLQMAANASNRTNKPPATSNGSMYSEHLNSSPVIGGKFPNTVSPVFPQSLVQSSNSPSPSQSPQWKSSRTPSASLGSSSQMMQQKNLPQQHSRSQPPMHAQISFGGNKKQQAAPSQGPPSSSHQGPSSPMMVGSPTTSSLSKGTSGSPRTNSSASTTNNKMVGHHSSPFSAQPPKNSASILGNSKAQMQQQQSQSQQKNMQQAHLFFSNPYSQPPHLSSPGGYSVPQRRPDQHQRVPSGTSTNDPATAIAAATSSSKGVSPFGAQSTGTLLPAGFSYVQVKPAEQKQPSGNDNLHHEKK